MGVVVLGCFGMGDEDATLPAVREGVQRSGLQTKEGVKLQCCLLALQTSLSLVYGRPGRTITRQSTTSLNSTDGKGEVALHGAHWVGDIRRIHLKVAGLLTRERRMDPKSHTTKTIIAITSHLEDIEDWW